MVLEYLLYKLYAVYDDYVKTNDHPRFLENLLSMLTAETQSGFGLITKRECSKKDLLKEESQIDIDSLFFMEEYKKNITLKITNMHDKNKRSSKKSHTSFILLEDSEQKSYECITKNIPSIKSIQAFPIYLNREKSSFYVCALGNRKGGYTVDLKRQLPLIMRTLSLLLSNYEAEQKLQNNVDLLEQFVENVPAAVAMFDKDMRYLMTSRQWIKQEKDLPTKSLKNKLHYEVVKDIPETWKKLHQKCLKGAIFKCDEEKFIRADGTVQWLKWELRPWYQQKKVGGLLMFLEHITEAKNAEEELRGIIKDLKESKAQIERFAYMCSHDLKEPLRTIYSFLQLIKKESEKFPTPQISEYYDFIFDGVYQMRYLIESLLIHSELGPKDIRIEPFKLSEVVDTVIKNNAHYILENGAKIQIDKDCLLYADKFLITQLLQNLVSNAFKYSKGRASYVHIGGSFQESGWEIYVKDNGIGIHKSYHKDIFNQFMRLDKNNESTSNGIGLAICKTIIKKHRGKIWLVSEEGKGTTFFFKIPSILKEQSEHINNDLCNVL